MIRLMAWLQLYFCFAFVFLFCCSCVFALLLNLSCSNMSPDVLLKIRLTHIYCFTSTIFNFISDAMTFLSLPTVHREAEELEHRAALCVAWGVYVPLKLTAISNSRAIAKLSVFLKYQSPGRKKRDTARKERDLFSKFKAFHKPNLIQPSSHWL